ncbi:alanine-zipper protein, partial [Proteus genomosp. 6]
NAQTTANSGVSKADAAQKTANDAVSKANTAQTTANNANTNANGRVPNTRKVNGKPLSADISLTAGDVGAATPAQVSEAKTAASNAQTAANNANTNANGRVPNTRKVNGKPLSSDITLTADDVGAAKVARNSMQKFNWPNNGASPINFGRNCSGKLCIIEFNDGGNMVKSTPFIIPQDTISWMHVVVGGAGELRFNISPTKIEKVQTWYHDVVAVYVEQ